MSLRDEFLRGGGCPIIDMHGHLGPYPGIFLPEGPLEAMIAGMDRGGVESIVLSPHNALHGDIREGNRDMLEAVRAYPGRVYGYCTVNPQFPQDMEAELETYLNEEGVAGIKIHPVIHATCVCDGRYQPVWERANSERRIVLSHTWAGPGSCSASDMRNVAERYPDVRILLGHSCYGEWNEAIALAADCPNVYLELTAAAHVNGLIEWMCEVAGASKVLFGTDFPWFDYASYTGFVVFADIDEDSMRAILYGNARRLLDEQLNR